MCIIIDNNVAGQVLVDCTDARLKPVREALLGPRPFAKMVHGGHLTREYLRNSRLRSVLRELDRAGRASVLPAAAVDAETARVRDCRLCKSDDPHVLAVARLGDVRLLCSQDSDLIRDFKDPKIINKPRGKVYGAPRRTATTGTGALALQRNQDLLRHHCQHALPATKKTEP